MSASSTAQAQGAPEGASDDVAISTVLTNAVAYQLRLAQEASFAAYLQRVDNPDLKPGRYTILMLLADNPGLTPTALSRFTGRDKSTLTATLKDLEARGYAERRRITADRRSYTVSLTPAGHDLLAQLRRHALAHDAWLDAIVGADKTRLMAILARITRALAGDDVGVNARPAREANDR